MFIVDSQVHIWAANTPERPWLPGAQEPHRPIPFSKDDLLREMDAAGVDRVIIVPPSMEGDRNDLALEAANLHPERFAVMGRIAADKPENKIMFSALKKQPGMKGLRLTISRPWHRPLITEGKASCLWSEAERADVPLMVAVMADLLPDISNIAEQHRGLNLAIDHLALVRDKKDEAAFVNLPQVLALAKWPNISVKVSALPCYSSENYPYRGIHRYIRQVYDAFGPERMFWRTDLTRLPCTYRQAITLFTEELPWLTTKDQEWIMGRALCRWLGWRLPVIV